MSFRPDLKKLLAGLPPRPVGVSGLAILCATSALVLVPAGAPAAAIAAALGGLGLNVLAALLQNAYQNLLSAPGQHEQQQIIALAAALEQELDEQPALAVEMSAFLQKMGADEVAAELARESPAHSWLLLSLKSDITGMTQKLQSIAGSQQYQLELDHSRHEQLGTALASISHRLDQLIAGVKPASPPFAVPYPRNPLFTGRDVELAALEEMLERERLAVVLSGAGGMGKTQLAVELCYRAEESGLYPGGVFWLTMDPSEGVGTQVAGFAGPEGLNLPGYDPGAFERNLAAVKRAWHGPERRLLVFDNLEEPALLDQWRPRTGGSRVLVTTRRGAWPSGSVEPLALLPLERPAALRLLLEPRAIRAGRTVDALLADRETARYADAICAGVGDLPLALALAAAYLDAYPNVTLRRYHQQLAAAPLEWLARAANLDEPLPTGHEKSVAATFALSYDRLDHGDPTDALALTLLHRAAHCAPAPIPPRLLLRAAGLDPDAEATPERSDPALRRLHTLGLLDPLPDGAQRLHRLIAAFARSRSSDPPGDAAAVERALAWEVHLINEAGYPLAGIPYLEHLWHAAALAEKRADRDAATLLNNLGYLLTSQGNLAAARPLYERALAIHEQALSPNHPSTAISLNNLASLLDSQGDYAAARPLYERALAIREQALGPNHPVTTNSLNNLAELLRVQGDYATARPLYERALAIREQALGPNHPNTAGSLNNLAELLRVQGDYAAARPLYERALAITVQALGPNHPDTAGSLNNLALLLYAQGDYAAARPLYERALAIHEQALGPNHPDTATSLNNLAGLLRVQGDYAAARPLYERAVAIFRQALGPDHPSTQIVQRNLDGLIADMEQGGEGNVEEG